MAAPTYEVSQLFVEIGAATILLAMLARIANRWGFSAIPLYLLAGLVLSKRGVAPIPISQSFIEAGAEIGVLMLLFMLGLEYGGEELKRNLQFGLPAGMVDFILNFTPGLAAGLVLRWGSLAAVLLGGITYISSSGVVAKVLQELRRINNPETPLVLAVLVLEDLAMAVYLPLVEVMLLGGSPAKIATSILIAVAVVLLVLVVALRYGRQLSDLAAHESDEVVVLTTFGAVLLVAGLAERFQVSAAIRAFLVGIALSGLSPRKRTGYSPRCCRDVLLLRTGDRRCGAAKGTAFGAGTWRSYGSYQNPNRMLGGEASRCGPECGLASRGGAGCARRVLDGDRGVGRRSSAHGTGLGWLRPLPGGSRPSIDAPCQVGLPTLGDYSLAG
jgi:predicted Kef-type K+ transport protein